MIFGKLKSRDPVAAANIGDLEHRASGGSKPASTSRSGGRASTNISDQDLLRQTVDEIIHDFINHERQHMEMEERIFFPAALNALRPEDWADIALKLANRHDPLYQPGLEEKFDMLLRKILDWR